jgi:hypothetical protein
MICSSVKRFFTSNLRQLGDWTPNRRATQNRGDVAVPILARKITLFDGEKEKLSFTIFLVDTNGSNVHTFLGCAPLWARENGESDFRQKVGKDCI